MDDTEIKVLKPL